MWKLKDSLWGCKDKCTNEILVGSGKMYSGGGEFTDNINKMGGEGTDEFVFEAIKIYCGK